MTPTSPKHFLVASDFDQTLSFNDSGTVLSELIGASRFQEKVDGLARSNLVQQGGELAYLIRHDPEFRGVRREHLEETGPPRAAAQQHPRARRLSRPRRRRAPVLVLRHLGGAARGHPVGARGRRRAGPHLRDRARVRRHTARCGRSRACRRATARSRSSRSSRSSSGIGPDRTIYVGDGSSDVHVMLHVNNRGGLHDCRLREPAARAHREEHAPQRRRVERDGADPREGARLGHRATSDRSSSRTA